jgi:hypothetical protein
MGESQRIRRGLLLLLCLIALSLGARAAQEWVCPMQGQVPADVLVDGGAGALHPRVWGCTPGMKGATTTFNYARNPNPTPGAYTLVVRLKLADNTVQKPVLRVYIAEEPGAPLGDFTFYATDIPVAGAYTNLRIPLLKSGANSIVAWQFAYLGNVPLWVDQIAVVPADARPGGPPPVEIIRFRTGKLIYWSDEVPAIEVSVKNNTPEAQSITLEVTGEAGLGQEVLRAEQRLALEPGATTEVEIPWPLRGRQYGFTVRGRLLRGDAVIDTRRHIFAIADNFNQVSQYGALYPDVDGAGFANVLEGYRAAYIGAFEVNFWAACDFSGMAPAQEKWLAGQGVRPIERAVLHGALKAARGQGIRALTYGDMWLSGPAGFEWARTHPEDTIWDRNWYGGQYDVDQLDAMRAGDEKAARQSGGWSALTPSLAAPAVQQFAAEEILRSVALFGWDGIRYDNYGLSISSGKNLLGRDFTAKLPKEAGDANANLIHKLRAALTAKYPRFVYGDNAMSRDAGNPPDAKWKAEAAKGGMIMDEAIGQQSGEATWAAIATHALLGAQTARAYGGYQLNIITNMMPKLCWSARPYPYILTMAAGAHVAYASPAHGMARYCAFGMRYGEFLYDLKARPLKGEVNPFDVAAPIWWQAYVTVRPLPGGRLQYIMSLINPPGAEKTTDIITPPKVLEQIPVTFRLPQGERVTAAWALSPEPEPHADKLDLPAGETITFTVPRLEYWSMVVVETVPEEVKK